MSRNSSIITLLTLSLAGVWAQPTPPIMPTLAETPLPPAVTLPAPAVAEVPNTPLTATEAARIALLRQPTVAVAAAGVAAAQGRLTQARAGLQPGVTVSSGYTVAPITAGSGFGSTGFTTGVTARQILFDYHHTRDLVRQATAQEQGARAGLTRAQSDLVFQVKQAYYTFAQNQRLAEVNAANLRNRREHLALAQARVNAGVGLPVDVVRAQTAVTSAIFSLNLAQNVAAVAQVALAQLMGLDPRTPLRVSEVSTEPTPAGDDVTTLLATALQRRPEIRQAQAGVAASQAGVSVAATNNAPVLVGTVAAGTRGDGLLSMNNNAVNLGVGVQWNAFDAGLTQGRKAEAQANLQAAQAQLQSASLTVSADVAQSYLNAKTAEQRLGTTDAEVANAQEALRLAQGRYGAGLGVFLDVLDAQAVLLTAQTNRVNAQFTINTTRAALAHALNNDPALEQAP